MSRLLVLLGLAVVLFGCNDPVEVRVPAQKDDPQKKNITPDPQNNQVNNQPDPKPNNNNDKVWNNDKPKLDGPERDVARRSWHVGQSVQGRPLLAELYGTQGPVLFLLAAIHGNERSAVTFGEQVRTTLLAGLAKRENIQIVFIGTANPDGAAARTRHNANDIDLNRNFDARNFGMGTHAGGDVPLSEPETVILSKITDEIAPSAVVSVHCCIPTLDYDGPGKSLAEGMADAANALLDERYDGAMYKAFPAERLGSSPGSMGSYVGLDLMIPIITLEFGSNHLTRTLYQLEAIHKSIEEAAAWTAENGQQTMVDIPEIMQALEDKVSQSTYGSTVVLDDDGHVLVRADHIGDVAQAPVLILSGVRDNDTAALHVAEHLRRIALLEHKTNKYGAISIISATNPTGILEGRTKTTANKTFDELFELDDPIAPEAQFVMETLSKRPPRLVILVEKVTGKPVIRGRQEVMSTLSFKQAPSFSKISEPLTGGFVRWLEARQIPVIQVGVHTAHGEGDDRRNKDYAFKDQQSFSRALNATFRAP